MKKSHYFAELASSYDAEIQDLLSDSEGKSALKARLAEKRKELKAIVPMIEFSPEMVVPVFYDAFAFPTPKAMAAAIGCEPDDGEFPGWDALAPLVKLESWALPLVEIVLTEGAGDAFMVTAACLEFIRKFDNSAPSFAADDDDEDSGRERGETDDSDDDDERDLAEAGDDWLAEQGFDSARS